MITMATGRTHVGQEAPSLSYGEIGTAVELMLQVVVLRSSDASQTLDLARNAPVSIRWWLVEKAKQLDCKCVFWTIVV